MSGAMSYGDAVGQITTSINAPTQLAAQVNNLAPLATVYHESAPAAPLPDFTASSQAGGGTWAKFGHFIGGVATDVGHITEGAAKFLYNSGISLATSAVRYGQGLSNGILDRQSLNEISSKNQQFSNSFDNLQNLYKSGRISNKDYSDGLKELNQDMTNLVKESTALNNTININTKDAYKATIDVSSLLLMFLGGKFGSTTNLGFDGLKPVLTPLEAKTSAEYLTSINANAYFQNVQNAIGKAADFRTLEGKALKANFTSDTWTAIQRSVAEVATNSTRLSAGQVARSAAINMSLKYPMYYSYLSGTGAQLYDELDKKNYGGAIRTAAFNAALLLSGGPIGWAAKTASKTVGRVSAAVFDRTGFWDQLSKFYGDKTTSGFATAAQKIADGGRDPWTGQFWKEADKKDFFQTLSDTAATNVKPVGGDQVAGANRVAEAMKAMYNQDLTEIDHQTALKEMYKFSKAQGYIDDIAKSNNLGQMTVGRVDSRSLINIGKAVSKGASVEERLGNWEVAKGQNPGWAWAHNPSFDRQVKRLIQGGAEGDALAGQVADIRAAYAVKGVPQAAHDFLKARGYIPISPPDIEAPFVKGSGKFESKFFDQTDDVFTKLVEPLPVARSVGTWLTNVAGLSPNASSQRVNQVFNANLADNLRQAPELASVMEKAGKTFEDDKQSADWLAKKLSSYAYAPTRGRIVAHMPIQDLRQLTKADIREATGASTSEAAAIQKAITRANLQVPMAIRGFGDRAVDRVFQLGPTGAVMRRYTRMQNALRFSWNPFYQYLRVIPKTEYLTEAAGGGAAKSLFTGRIGQVNKLREDLRGIGAFDQKGGLGSVEGAEAVDAAGLTGRNLGKKLLPAQEVSIAGLVDDQARRMGMDAKTYINTYPEKVRDTVQAIAQYDKHYNFLNSPMARTLNIAFFPFRFEAKVAAATVKGLSRTSLLTQTSVIHGMFQAHQWLNSPEGQAWYSQNADAIGIFKYITPLANFNEVFQSLMPGHDHSLGNFGELGGLPFGWIPAILDAEGLTNFNQTAVNPKTGQPFPTYVPATTKGQAAIAVQDFLGAIFSYPGATVGLPSKTGIARSAALGIVGGNKARDLRLTTPPTSSLSPQAQSYSQAISGGANAPVSNTPPPPVSPTSVPTLPTSTTTPKPVAPKSSTGTKKKKKADFVPALLPGQTTLGQL